MENQKWRKLSIAYAHSKLLIQQKAKLCCLVYASVHSSLRVIAIKRRTNSKACCCYMLKWKIPDPDSHDHGNLTKMCGVITFKHSLYTIVRLTKLSNHTPVNQHDLGARRTTYRVRRWTFWTSWTCSTPTWRMKSCQERRLSTGAPLTTWRRRRQFCSRTTPAYSGVRIDKCGVRFHDLRRWWWCHRIGLTGFATSSLWWFLVLQHTTKAPARCHHAATCQNRKMLKICEKLLHFVENDPLC